MSISIFHCLEPDEFIFLKKPELYPAFSSLKANFAMPDSYFMETVTKTQL